VIVLDTCALIFDALDPARLGPRAARLIEEGAAQGTLTCSDISLWEVAMLAAKGRLHLPTDSAAFLRLAMESRQVRVLPITPEIAHLSSHGRFGHADPADRIIAATALTHNAVLLSCDQRLRETQGLRVVW